MVISSGRVVAGKIVLDGDPLLDGAVVTILTREGDETFAVDAAMEAELLESLGEADPVGRKGHARASESEVNSRLPVVFTRRAARHVEEARQWWRNNRTKAPGALLETWLMRLTSWQRSPRLGRQLGTSRSRVCVDFFCVASTTICTIA